MEAAAFSNLYDPWLLWVIQFFAQRAADGRIELISASLEALEITFRS
jgi:hypothetical protein